MKMSRNRFYPIIVGFMAVSLLIGFLAWRSWVNQNGLLGQKQAIQNAIQACNPAHGFQPVEQPTKFQAELTTYGKAEPAASNLYTSERPVWVVEMKGRWRLVGGPPPDPNNPGPFYSDECTIIIDAQTGESLSLIREEVAIQNAIPVCGEIGLQPVEQPTEIEAKLIWGGAEIPPYNSDPARPVWVVWMKGRWILVGGPRLAPDPSNPTPQPGYDTECVIKIDALTGVSVSAVIE